MLNNMMEVFIKYSLIYESGPPSPISVPLIIMIIVFILLLALAVSKRVEARKIHRIVILIVDVTLLFIMICIVYNWFDVKEKVWDKYRSGEYLVAEGTIEKYEKDKEHGYGSYYDEFTVSGVYFTIPGDGGWGYPLRQTEGGILGNGLRVRISYIPYLYYNAMIKLELLESQ